ncbi:MAG: hypothetical protein ABIG20_02890 [archaeon]
MGIDKIYTNKLADLKKQDAKAVSNHLNKVAEALNRKKDILDGNIEELLENITNPREEVTQIMALIDEVESTVKADLLAELLALEVSARELVESIDREYAMVIGLEASNDTSQTGIEKEIADEMEVVHNIEHQLNRAVEIHALTKGIIEKAAAHENEEQRNKISESAVNINDIVSYISNIILREELPNLKIVYSLLRLADWPDAMDRILTLEKKFEEIEPKLL